MKIKTFVTTYSRTNWPYWSDRITGSALLVALAVFFLATGVWAWGSERSDLGPMAWLAPLVGVLLLGAAVWLYRYPWPYAVEIDETEIRVIFRPQKVVSVARSRVVGVRCGGYAYGRSCGLIYRTEDGKQTQAPIGWGYRRQDGTYFVGLTIRVEMNERLGVKTK